MDVELYAWINILISFTQPFLVNHEIECASSISGAQRVEVREKVGHCWFGVA